MTKTSVSLHLPGVRGRFKLDKNDLNDIRQAISDARKQSLTDALAVFAGRAKSVIDFAESKIAQFEKGYFAAQFGGISGKDMRALEAVAQDVGVSVEAVRNGVQALHRNVRDDPAAAVLLEQLHISRRDGAGGPRNSADLLLALSDALKRMDQEQARQTGERLGVAAGVMEVVRNPEFAPRLLAQREAQENSKIEAAGARAHQVMITVRELSRYVDEMFAQALLTMGPRLQQMLEGLSAWFKDNGQEAGKRIGELGNFVLSLLSLLRPVVRVITWLDGATGGLSSQIMLLVGGFLSLGGSGVAGALADRVARLGRMRSIIGGLGRHLASLARGIGAFVSRVWPAAGHVVSAVFGRITALGRAAATQMGGMASAVWSWMASMAARGGALVVDSVKAAGAIALQWGQSLWESAGSWIGRLVEVVKVLGRGVVSLPAAVGLGLALYPRSLGDGTLKPPQGEPRFLPGPSEPDVAQPGRDIRLPVMDGALVEPWRDYRSGFATREAAGGVLAPMSAPAAPVSVNATTHVYVNGSADPAATGYAVANQQSRVNADLTRNLQGSYD